MERGTSNMAVMDVTLPSGFTVDKESLSSLTTVQDVKRWETRDGDTGVVIYFDKIGREQVCPTVKSYRTFKVAKQKPVAVKVYDYYDLTKTSRIFYEARAATLCDICEHGDDCRNFKCEPRIRDNEIDDGSSDGRRTTSGSSSSYSRTGILSTTIILLLTFVKYLNLNR
jgi:CD109 antigen